MRATRQRLPSRKRNRKEKESPFKEWSAAPRATPGILGLFRAAIFAPSEAHTLILSLPLTPSGYINANFNGD